MERSVKIFLYGKFPEISGGRSKIDKLNLADSVSLTEFLSRVGLPAGSVQLVMVNYRAVGKDAMIHPGDRVSIFGREYPIFADWLSQRTLRQTVRD